MNEEILNAKPSLGTKYSRMDQAKGILGIPGILEYFVPFIVQCDVTCGYQVVKNVSFSKKSYVHIKWMIHTCSVSTIRTLE